MNARNGANGMGNKQTTRTRVAPTPVFSVVVPLYNKREYVIRAVRSVLSQSEVDFELLVVDDGSTDGSADLLEAEVQDHRLHVIRQANQGGAGGQARNTGMAQARGQWFAFLDADDLWLSNHLEELSRIIRHGSRPALISTRPCELPSGSPAELDSRKRCNISEVDYFLLSGRCIGLNHTSSTAIHREIFEMLGGFAYHPAGEDLEYWARVALEYPILISDRTTSIYYRGTHGVMESIAAQRKRQPYRKPERLADVSPSLAMLARKADVDPELLKRTNIRAYINGRLYAGMRINIRQGNARTARAMRKMMMGPVPCRTHVLTLAAWIPEFILKKLNVCLNFYWRKAKFSK